MEKKPKVGLIIPPSPFLCDERVFPALGPLRVAGALHQGGVPVEVIDCSGYADYTKIVEEYCLRSDTKIFGIGCTTPQLQSAEAIIRAIRSAKPEAKIILAGVHVTTACTSCKREKKNGQHGRATKALNHLLSIADILISGDGERSIFSALEKDSPKLIDADDPESPLFLQSDELALFPFPMRELIDLSSYHYSIDGVPSTSIVAQLGCPFACGYCGARFSPSFRRVRLRPIDNVLAEIEYIYHSWGIKGFFFLDDELNVNKNLLTDLIAFRRLQDRLGIEFRCRGFLKSELLNEPQARAFYEAGWRNVLIGFEAADSRILKNINKRATLDDNNRAMEICHKVGLKVKCLMSCGHPGESPETINAIQKWLLKVEPADFDLTIIQPYFSTPYFDLAIECDSQKGIWVYRAKSGDRLYMQDVNFSDEPLYYKGIPGDYKAFVHTDHISSEEIVTMRDAVEKEVREKLGIASYSVTPASRFEHSMGQGFPANVLRSSDAAV